MAFSCSSCSLSSIPKVWQFRLLGIILLVLGVIDYLVDIAENYIIADKSQTDEIVYQYSSTILNIFSKIFIFMNTGLLTMLTVRESSANDTKDKRKNISKIFLLGSVGGLLTGLAVMCILLIFRVNLFDMFRQSALAKDASIFFSIRAPFVPLEYLNNVFFSIMLGLTQLHGIFLATFISNVLYLGVLFMLIKVMEDTVAAIALANGFQIVVAFSVLLRFIVIFLSGNFRKRYQLFDFNKTKQTAKQPLLGESFPEERETEKDETSFKELGKASLLLFAKNFCTTSASVTGSILLSSTLSQTQFVANNVLSNTMEFSAFAAFFNTVLNIFGPKLIAAGERQRYVALYKKAHIGIFLTGVVTFCLFFFLHTGNISLKHLTSADNKQEVQNILHPIWPIWGINIMLTMYMNLYDTALINFQNVLGALGIFNSLFVAIPISLISALHFHSLIGIPLGLAISNGIEVIVGAYLFHFKYLKTVENNSQVLLPQSIQYDDSEKN